MNVFKTLKFQNGILYFEEREKETSVKLFNKNTGKYLNSIDVKSLAGLFNRIDFVFEVARAHNYVNDVMNSPYCCTIEEAGIFLNINQDCVYNKILEFHNVYGATLDNKEINIK